MLAPIILFVYNRPDHTRLTLDSLIKNELSEKSNLFIFSDAPKSDSDTNSVNEVRKIIRGIRGFADCEIIERETNFGLAKSVISGVAEIINQYQKVIVLEDDIVTSPGFLMYMNNALEKYEGSSDLYSISGYSLPIPIPKDYILDVYKTGRPTSWGWATWKDKWEKAIWSKNELLDMITHKKNQKGFNKIGNDLTPMLKAQLRGEIDSWAVRWAFSHFIKNANSLVPTISLTKNIGTDSTGTNFQSSTNKFDVDLQNVIQKIELPDELVVNKKIELEIKKLMNLSIFRKLVNFIKYDLNLG